MSSWMLVGEDGEDGWDLNAVVRSCRPVDFHAAELPQPQREPVSFQSKEVLLSSYRSDLIEKGNAVHDLEELCKPFISSSQQQKSLPPDPSSLLAQPRQHIARSKRRRNQQKRVIQIPADGLSGDMWAWRKYGQKPIKGSPYPRGYYRCSTSKGCSARKQLELSRTEPGMLVIAYTGEHNHPLPSHRNSLAGSTRQKHPASEMEGIGNNLQELSTYAGEGGPRLSPNTPLAASMDLEEDLLRRKKKEREEAGTDEDGDENDEEVDMLSVEDMELLVEDDVMFMGADDLNTCLLF